MSDAADGWIARKFDATSNLGALLDPVADKLMLSGAYLIFGLNHVIPMWLTWIVLGRDVSILLFAAFAYMLTSIRNFPPSRWGKLSTLIQILTALAILVTQTIPTDPIAAQFQSYLVWLCAAVTLWSAGHYLWLAINRLRATAGIRY